MPDQTTGESLSSVQPQPQSDAAGLTASSGSAAPESASATTWPAAPVDDRAEIDSMIDSFLGERGTPVEVKNVEQQTNNERQGADAEAAPGPEADQAQPKQPERDAILTPLLEQNRQLMEMLANQAKGVQPAADAPKPAADASKEAREQVIKQLQEDMGLSKEDAEKHYAIIEKVAEIKAAPALEAAKSQRAERERLEQAETEKTVHAEAVRIIDDNQTIFGKSDVPFASLTPDQQKSRKEFVETFHDMYLAQKSRGVTPDVKSLLTKAFRASVGDDTAMSRARQELSKQHEAAKQRRTVPPAASRNGTTTPQMIRRGNMTLPASEAAEIDEQITKYLAANGG